tara:strand:- start:244 stop:963 length:720 start_codon:yes stop_codon:yes gene_type:complete
MAKDLPYFKFFCSEWNDGDITLESYKTQGIFINICSYYWSNECDVTLKNLKKKFRFNTDDIDYLIKERLIKSKEDYISISFLDEQCIERGKLSNTNSKNAKSRWDKIREKSERNANASDSQSENNAIKKREEKKRKDIDEFWDLYHSISNKLKSDLQPSIKHWDKLTEIEKDKAKCNIQSYVDSVNDPKYIVKARTYLADKKFNDEFNPPIPKKMTQERWDTMNEAERVTYFKNSLKNG